MSEKESENSSTKEWTRRELLLSSVPAMAALHPAGHGWFQSSSEPSGGPAAARSFPIRGIMVDAARQPELPSYYRRCVDFCAEWGYNTLIFRLTDDQGSMLRFPDHPELLTHPNALTPEQARDLALYGVQHGVDIIPEIESFGHTHYITGSPKWQFLSDASPAGRGDFGGVIPVLPATAELITSLYREVASIFPSRYLHAGCDEVNWGGSAASQAALKTHSRAQIWAQYLNRLDQAIQSLGKQMIVWGDYVVHKEPAILPLLHKDIIVMDWNYWDTGEARIEKAARMVLNNGSRLIGGPGLVWCRWGPRVSSAQLRNIDAFADVYRSLDHPGCLGVVITNWIPCRYLADSLWDGFAYAAVALQQGSEAARRDGFARFVARHYGASWNESWAQLFTTLYAEAPNRRPCAPRGSWPILPVPWRDPASLRQALHAPASPELPFTRLVSLLPACEAGVRDRYDDFRSFSLSVRYLQQLYWREQALREAAALPSQAAAAALRTIAEHDRLLLADLVAAWNRSRPANDPGAFQPVYGLRPGDQLLATFRQAAAYSAHLARHPEELTAGGAA